MRGREVLPKVLPKKLAGTLNTQKCCIMNILTISVYTMAELKFTGNCLKGSRPLLSFDKNFTTNPHYSLLRELFVQV